MCKPSILQAQPLGLNQLELKPYTLSALARAAAAHLGACLLANKGEAVALEDASQNALWLQRLWDQPKRSRLALAALGAQLRRQSTLKMPLVRKAEIHCLALGSHPSAGMEGEQLVEQVQQQIDFSGKMAAAALVARRRLAALAATRKWRAAAAAAAAA